MSNADDDPRIIRRVRQGGGLQIGEARVIVALIQGPVVTLQVDVPGGMVVRPIGPGHEDEGRNGA